MIMKRLGQLLCLSLLMLTFSCDPDEIFDAENPDSKLTGDWEVVSVESISYSSTMASPNGQEDTSRGSFTGTDINMSLTFNADNTFSTSGDYMQILAIESPLPDPIMFESRFNDFDGGGIWEFSGDLLLVQNIAETTFQNAEIGVFTDTEVEFDYAYTRTLFEGTITRVIDVEVSYVLERK